MEGEGLSVGSIPSASSVSPPFLSRTYDMVDDPTTDSAVSWSKSNNSFVVWNVPKFSKDLLSKYFKHNNFSSFVRQLNTYSSFVGSCVEVGKFGIDEEVERLKRDKNVLMQELVRLRRQQLSTDNQLKTVGQHVHLMEQRPQQMMLFLAKAMHSPGFVALLVHDQNESNRHIFGGNKKRRLSTQEEEVLGGKLNTVSPDGQIVKYQPLINEAAKSMLRQILKMNATGRLE